tara:strand:- start:10941 stop:12731 length:1791 start_codon:yes stop_codon:yes gene_type:complete
MLNAPIEDLKRRLLRAIESSGVRDGEFGHPHLVEAASKEAEKVFQGIAKSRPSKEDAYAAALAFMRGYRLEEWQFDLLSSAVCTPIREQQGATLLGHARFSELLAWYERECSAGELWWLTWYGLLGSYFEFRMESASEAERTGWKALRALLQKTWPKIDCQFAEGPVPDWAKVLRGEPQLLTQEAADSYGFAYLEGDQDGFEHLKHDLGIPGHSWFYHLLVLAAVRSATTCLDGTFKKHLPRLTSLIDEQPAYRDEAIELILSRYYKCSDRSVHPQLRDYVVRKDVWRNPKLKSVGLATAWNRVSEAVWKMVLGWVNEGNLRDFFDILAAKSKADQGRLAFWSQYLEQISWTRLVFGSSTLQLAQKNPAVRQLIAREEGAYALLTGNQSVDAFMMQIGDYIAVEFTKTGHAAYVYALKALPFDQFSRSYSGGTDDLRGGFNSSPAARITHHVGWEDSARADLEKLNIFPDKKADVAVAARRNLTSTSVAKQHAPSPARERVGAPAVAGQFLSDGVPTVSSANRLSRPPIGAKFTMTSLQECLSGFEGAHIDDQRGLNGGRLWINDPRHHFELNKTLIGFGFLWSESKRAWFYPVKK